MRDGDILISDELLELQTTFESEIRTWRTEWKTNISTTL